jgi:hypothetical protein
LFRDRLNEDGKADISGLSAHAHLDFFRRNVWGKVCDTGQHLLGKSLSALSHYLDGKLAGKAK